MSYGRRRLRVLALAAAAASAKDTTVFYNVYAKPGEPTNATAAIVREQMDQLVASPLWASVGAVRYATVGASAIADVVAETCEAVTTPCFFRGHAERGDEGLSLSALYEHCVSAAPGARVAYVHDKGSFDNRPQQARLRTGLMRALASAECGAAVKSGSCDVCSLRFSPWPHQHASGNMWLASCDYVKRLLPPRTFQERMRAFGLERFGDCFPKLQGWAFGFGRFAFEHWVHAHPTCKPCDAVHWPFQWSYAYVPPADFPVALAAAPRYAVGHPWAPHVFGANALRDPRDDPTFAKPEAAPLGASDPRLSNPTSSACTTPPNGTLLENHLAEWAFLYGAEPPVSSKVRAFYAAASHPCDGATGANRGGRRPCCAPEGGVCACATGKAAFGAGDAWVEAAIFEGVGRVSCSAAAFGSDPAPGAVKWCRCV